MVLLATAVSRVPAVLPPARQQPAGEMLWLQLLVTLS